MLVHGGGDQQRRHLGGSRQGGWWSGCADKVERWRPGWALLANRRSLSLLTTPCSTLPQFSGERLECGLQLRKGTTTTAPNPPHNTCPNQWRRGPGTSESSRCPVNASDSQPRSAYLGAGGGGGCQRAAQAGHGWNTPRTPQEGTFLEAEEINHPTDPGRRLAKGRDQIDRGASGRTSTPWWMGAAGKGKRVVNYRCSIVAQVFMSGKVFIPTRKWGFYFDSSVYTGR